jgi:hypothetical protein
VKIGNEAEGRFKGLYTLFLTAKEARIFFNFKSLKERILSSSRLFSDHNIDRIRHVYISDHGNMFGPKESCLFFWADMKMPVTLERTEIKDRLYYPKNVHMMLAIEDKGKTNTAFWELAPTDQIKFSAPKGHAHQVFCVTKENMSLTNPEDFDGDITLRVSEAKKYLIQDED